LPASALFFFTAPAAVFLFGMTKRKMGAGFLSGKAADCCDMPLEGECLRSENDDMESGKTEPPSFLRRKPTTVFAEEDDEQWNDARPQAGVRERNRAKPGS